MASVVVVSYNTAAHIEACLRSLLALDYPRLEIIVVDNASTDGSAELVRSRFPQVELIELPDNRGFAGGASVGLFIASGTIVATVNPDVRLDPGWMSAMARTLLSMDEVGVVGSKILYPDGKTIQHAGGIVHYPLATTEHIGRGEPDHGQYERVQTVSFVTGAALAMRADVGRDLKFFDERFYPLYYEDVDLCWRASQQGLRTIYQPAAVAFHEESVTMDRKSTLYYSYYHANRLRFVTKHYTPDQMMLDFLPAEAARIAGDMPAEDRKASLALLDHRHTVNLRERADAGPSDAAAGAGSAQVGSQSPVLTTQRRWDQMQVCVDEVMLGWRVREQPFASSVPVVGGLIAWLRERLNNLSTRWYVQPILQQQVEYNAAVARALRELSRQLAEVQARVALQSLLTANLVSLQAGDAYAEELSAELEALRVRIEQLEREVQRTGEQGVVR